MRPELVVVRGGGELATAASRLLFLAGFRVIVLEREPPLAVRRRVCFAEAVVSGVASVEGVQARRSRERDAREACGYVPVLVDAAAACLERLEPAVLVEARMTKRAERQPRACRLTIALGPGCEAGRDADAVVETQRGADLGRVLWAGAARADSGVPEPVLGVGEPRVLRAPSSGTFRGRVRIGELVGEGAAVGTVDDRPVRAGVAGLVRGLLADGVAVEAGTKLGDVDPRGAAVDPAWISDKGRAVAAGVLEAVCLGLARR